MSYVSGSCHIRMSHFTYEWVTSLHHEFVALSPPSKVSAQFVTHLHLLRLEPIPICEMPGWCFNLLQILRRSGTREKKLNLTKKLLIQGSCISSIISTGNTFVRIIAFGMSFNLNLQFQSHLSFVNRTWHKRPRERDDWLRFEIQWWYDTPNAIACTTRKQIFQSRLHFLRAISQEIDSRVARASKNLEISFFWGTRAFLVAISTEQNQTLNRKAVTLKKGRLHRVARATTCTCATRMVCWGKSSVQYCAMELDPPIFAEG